jgi:hypothetical protein
MNIHIISLLTICITCAGNHQTLKPDAAVPRQVHAVVSVYSRLLPLRFSLFLH